jgi:hypothetical protein
MIGRRSETARESRLKIIRPMKGRDRGAEPIARGPVRQPGPYMTAK